HDHSTPWPGVAGATQGGQRTRARRRARCRWAGAVGVAARVLPAEHVHGGHSAPPLCALIAVFSASHSVFTTLRAYSRGGRPTSRHFEDCSVDRTLARHQANTRATLDQAERGD